MARVNENAIVNLSTTMNDIVKPVSWEVEDGDKCEPEPVLISAEVHAFLETVKSFSYAHSIRKHDEQKILTL